eukprot:m.345502 g.345502  ORF g.345502 m.345502 type:complete len:455 (+) comp27897_c1_seq1:1889-3253(+)
MDVGKTDGSSDNGATPTVATEHCGCHSSWSEHEIEWMRVVVVHDLMKLDFSECCSDTELGLTKRDVADILHDILLRRPTKTEVDEIFEWLDTDGDGIIDPSEWRVAQWRSEVEFIAGSARAASISTIAIITRILPRIPVIKFFRPRAMYTEIRPSVSRIAGVTARLIFLGGSIVAATAAFLAQRHCRRLIDPGSNSVTLVDLPDLDGLPVTHFVAGGVGGALHAVIMSGVIATSKLMHLTNMKQLANPVFRAESKQNMANNFWRRLPAMMVKDALGFAMFFGVFHVVQGSLEEWLFKKRASDGESFTRRRPLVEAVGVAGVSGAAAGLAYHTVSHPMERARAIAPRTAGVFELLATGRSAGPARLFRHFTRNGALLKSIIIGSVTFASYDAALRLTGGLGSSSHAAQLAPRTTRDAMLAIDHQRSLVSQHTALASTLQNRVAHPLLEGGAFGRR